MLECMGNYGVFFGLRGEFGPQGGVLNLAAGIWALGLVSGFGAGIWASRLRFGI